MEYSITERDEKDIKSSKIQKLGVVVNFTYAEIEQHEEMLRKAAKEVKAKRDYEQVRVDNIKEHHADVAAMSEEELFAAHMYQEATSMVKMADDKLAEIDEQLSDYEVEKAEIIKQIPELAGELSPIQDVTNTNMEPEEIKVADEVVEVAAESTPEGTESVELTEAVEIPSEEAAQ